MDKGRLEAFSDGVIAIIITIMVLEIATPKGSDIVALESILPRLMSYAISFVFVGIYWNNHHHLLNLVTRVNGRLLWANLLFLFVLSLVPVATDWIDVTGFAMVPTTAYVVLNMLVSLSYMNLEREVRSRRNAKCCMRESARMHNRLLTKECLTIALQLVALALALLVPGSHLAYVALLAAFALWIVPDLRIDHALDSLCRDEDD